MKGIQPFDVDDIRELQLLADNNRLGSYPQLMSEYILFKEQYANYVDSCGDPWKIRQLPISNTFRKALIRHYDDAPQGHLQFITDFRRNLSPTLCVMCGGFGNGTLDHYLPSSVYPEYSFFSKNLIPACNCNSLRGNVVRGLTESERVIHPYFDNFLDQRLYQAVFIGSFDAPSISIEVIDSNHPEIDLLKFHLANVIANEATQGWFEKYWSDLSLRPYDILELVLPLPQQIVTGAALAVAIERYRNAKDKEHHTPNNWHSIFYTGLMKDLNRLEQLAEIINISR
ncbi:hypothetical protein [Arsukibacterium ikkense]|uniref:hypothetical protein n=1 Tax=Arsukibacterium ikkense TaxID=336831 RepID=UPI00069C1EC5|nr:hypothetical protein [Arsukibacterium ikkense]